MPPSSTEFFLEAFARGNLVKRGEYERYRSHREAVMDKVPLPATKNGKLCVLGAGNGNDLDLTILCERFARVALVDIDEQALAWAARRVEGNLRRRIRCHAPVDVSGFLSLQMPGGHEPSADLIETWRNDAPEALASQIADRFDVVLSDCLLTQMSWTLGVLFPSQAHVVRSILPILVDVHLRSLARLCKPGGDILLVTDYTSSEHVALPSEASGSWLARLMEGLIAQKCGSAIANPPLIESVLSMSDVLQEQFESIERFTPWLWYARERRYLVYGWRFRTSQVAAP